MLLQAMRQGSTEADESSYLLSVAARCGHRHLVELLSNDVDVLGGAHCPLAVAVDAGQQEMALLMLGRVRSLKDEPRCQLPVLLAAANKSEATFVKSLLDEYEADVYCRGPQGRTPLYAASREGRLTIVRLLIADAMKRDGLEGVRKVLDGDTWMPLRAAVEKGHAEVTTELVLWHRKVEEHHADFLRRRISAYEKAIRDCHQHVPLLLDYEGLDKSLARSESEMLAIISVGGGCVEIVSWLLTEKMAEPNHLMHCAAGSGQAEVVQLLLRRGATPDILLQGLTPLMHAASRGYTNIVPVLLGASTAVDMQEERYGRTALHIACSYGNVNVALELIRGGASTLVRDGWGRTPRDMDVVNEAVDRHVDRLHMLCKLNRLSFVVESAQSPPLYLRDIIQRRRVHARQLPEVMVVSPALARRKRARGHTVTHHALMQLSRMDEDVFLHLLEHLPPLGMT